jgi:hypothetical protein
MELENSRYIFEKHENTKFYENLFMGTEIFHADGQTHMTNLLMSLRNFSDAPKNSFK